MFAFKFSIYPSHKAPWVIFVKVNAGLLTLLDAATKVMQEEMIKNVSNIEKYQPLPYYTINLYCVIFVTIFYNSFQPLKTK